MIRHGARFFASFVLLVAAVAITLAGLAAVIRVGHLMTDQGDLRGWVQVAALLASVVVAMVFLLAMAFVAEQIGGFTPRQIYERERALQRAQGRGGMRTGPPPPAPPGPASPPKPPDHRPVS